MIKNYSISTTENNEFKNFKQLEKEIITKAMFFSSFNKAKAARILKIGRCTLINKIKLHKIDLDYLVKIVDQERTVEEARTGVTELPRPNANRNGVD